MGWYKCHAREDPRSRSYLIYVHSELISKISQSFQPNGLTFRVTRIRVTRVPRTAAEKFAKAAYMRGWYAKNKYRVRPNSLWHGGRGKASLYGPGECEAIRFLSVLDRAWISAHQAAIKKLTCKKCGNDRVSNPDRQGKCRACLAAKRKGKRAKWKARRRASGAHNASQRAHKRNRRARLRANGGTVSPTDWGACAIHLRRSVPQVRG